MVGAHGVGSDGAGRGGGVMNLVISQELAQRVTDYLATRPYREVFHLIDQLTKLRPLEEPKADASHAPGDIGASQH